MRMYVCSAINKKIKMFKKRAEKFFALNKMQAKDATQNLYIAPGLLRDHAKDLKLSVEEAQSDLASRAFQIIATYEADDGHILYWTRRDRTALNCIFQNHLADRETKNKMLRDLAGCDEVLLPLRDILKFSVTCESRARFLVKISNFCQKLNSRDLDLLGDCVTTLVRWTVAGVPAEPKENDLFLIECFNYTKSSIPEGIDKELHDEFVADRLGKVVKVVTSVNNGELI